MQVTIRYSDDSSFTTEEVVKFATSVHGKNAKVTVEPESRAPHDLIYFAIQQIISNNQIAMLFDNKYTYQNDIKKLRADVLQELTEILDTVIMDNENKVA